MVVSAHSLFALPAVSRTSPFKYDNRPAKDNVSFRSTGVSLNMADKESSDLENGLDDKAAVGGISYTDDRLGSVHEEVARARQIQNGFAPLRILRHGEEWLDAKLGIETQGIDRIPEEAKRPPSIINTFFIWWSVTLHVGTLPIGFLGPEFGLSLNQSVAAIVLGTFLGALCTAYTGTLGPKVSNMRLWIPPRR